ncbi:MAG: hypothetical protein A2Z18_09680 [Armatimonadetes bacterium RBG_16_58_9]|nr:MAG: hypothetical protein A2Z18_09680 [Armatimonadetes bacterium RBG_16_58_9]
MSLLLTETRDQALLAMVVQAAHNAVRKRGGFVGRTAVQKIVYFLQVGGVQMNYRFKMYHYGPFCKELLDDIDWLLADEVLKDESSRQEKYSNYVPGEQIQELLSLHDEYLKKHRKAIEGIVEALAPLRPERMEEIATLYYVFRQQKAKVEGEPTKEAVVSAFVGIKSEKFPRSDVETLYDVMSKAGMLCI